MGNAKKLDLYTTKYMRNFRCIGKACGEGNCCHGWQITIDQGNYKKLKKVMDKTADDRESFKKKIKKNRSNVQGEQSFAAFVMNPVSGYCQFFDDQGLCEIHGRFGEQYLCNTCRSYPRKLNQYQDRQELSGSISCPEIARLCLLQENSTEAGPAERNDFDLKGLYNSNATKNLHAPYAAYVHDIRSILDQFLSLIDLPLSSRLFFICYLANRTAPFFKRGGQFTEDQLAAEIDRITTPAMLTELHQGYQNLDSDLQIPLQLIDAIFTAKGEATLPAELFQGIVDIYGLAEKQQNSTSNSENEKMRSDINEILATYTLRKQKLQQRFGEKLDLTFTNFCKNHIFSCPYTESDDLLQAMQALLARTTTAAFFLYSNTQLDPLIDERANTINEADAVKILNEVIVDVFYRFSRSLEHDKNVWDKVFRDADKTNLATFAILTQLLKFME